MRLVGSTRSDLYWHSLLFSVLLWELPHNKLDRSLQAESWSASEVAVCMVASPMLISEVAHPSQRSRVMTMYEPTYPLGSLIGAYITYGTSFYSSSWSWRLPVILQALLSIVQGIFLLMCPRISSVADFKRRTGKSPPSSYKISRGRRSRLRTSQIRVG